MTKKVNQRMKINILQVYVKDEERDIIEEASKIVSLNVSAFIRFTVLKEARKILKESRNDNYR